MHPWLKIAGVAALIIAAGGHTLHAQSDAANRIQAAYEDYAGWDSYEVQFQSTTSYALTAQGKGASFWQKQERELSLSGSYDLSGNPGVLLAVTGQANESSFQDGQVTPETWKADLSAALVDDTLFWRGSYTGPDAALIPAEWEPFTLREAASLPVPDLNRYLLQNGDPFVGDVAAWLKAAESIDGPQAINLDRSTPGDLYVITVPVAKTPALLDTYTTALLDSIDGIANPDAFLTSLKDNSTLTWRVVLAPDSDRLLAHNIQLDLSAELGSSAMLSPYTSLSLDSREDTSILFSGINQPVDIPALSS